MLASGKGDYYFLRVSLVKSALEEDHTSKNIWAAQIDLDAFKEKKGHKVRLVGKQGEMDLGRVGGGELNMIKTCMTLKRIKRLKANSVVVTVVETLQKSLIVLYLL